MNSFDEPISIDASSRGDSTDCDIEATILYNLGHLYIQLGESEEALEAFWHAVKTLRWHPAFKRSKTHDAIAIAILHNIGHIQYRTGLYKDAV